MKREDFYQDVLADPWGKTVSELKDDLFRQLRSGPIAGDNDLETALTLTQIVHADLERCGTSGDQEMTEDQITAAQRCLKAVLARHAINLELPWRNFAGFRTYWNRHNAHGSWQARREILTDLFGPVYDELERLDEAAFRADLAEPVSPHTSTGWPLVDTEISELRRRFRSAQTPQDYRDVGNRSVAVLEALSRTVYDPTKHLREGETEPAVDKTKQRLGRYVEDSLAGAHNEAIRTMTSKVIDLAHKIKHSPAPTRRDAGITADAVIALANILRRVDQDL